MFKSIRMFTLAITLMAAFLPVLTACNNTQPAALITPAPTIGAANPLATTVAAVPTSIATKVVPLTIEATSTPLAAKPAATTVNSSLSMTATQVATAAVETARTPVAVKANPTAVKPAAAKAAPAAVKPSVATTWTVLVGGETGVEKQETGSAGAWQFMRFYPETITINAGDTIVWKQNSAEPHTVTFLKPGEKSTVLVIPEGKGSQRMIFNPEVIMPQGSASYDGATLTGSGQMGGEPQFPKEYKLTFTKPGTYEYICAFHPMMKGKIIVQVAGESYPQTPAQIEAAVKAQLEADSQAALKVKPDSTEAVTRAGTKGSTIHEVKIGYGDGMMAWMRFSPADLTIKVGDTVEWTQADMDTPHTVSFLDQGKEPEMVLVEKQTAGLPKLVLNPEVLQPAGGATYSGQGYFNSGFIWGTKDPTPGPRTYSLTFDKAGTYKYTCILHDGMGMRGTITVKAK